LHSSSSILFLKNGDKRFEALMGALHDRGYAVDAVSAAGEAGATDAVARIAERPYRAVIADLSPKEIDGAGLLRSIAERSPESLFIAIAGLDQEHEARKLLDAGAAASVMDCFRRLHGAGMTVLMVTHNLALLPYATRRVVCREGGLVAA